jgi:tripartite-type tricarboxylate transporter receptor subunit TctC
MSPSSICTHKTLRAKSSKRVVTRMGRPMMVRSGLLACFVLLGVFSPQLANAVDDYPKRQIKIIVPFPAGAGPDQVARMLGQHLQDAFGQTVVIENRAGALGSIGAQEVARSAPDGYTLLMGTNTTQAANVAMLKHLPYDPAKDFAPIIRTITTAMVLVVKPDFPAKNLAQFMEYARTHPNLTAGYGSGASQISIGQLQTRGGMSVIAASYRGVPQAVTDVIAGVVDLAFADFSIAIPQIQGGTLRGIGVTSPKRNDLTPDLPSLAEAMPDFEATIWYGLLAPAGTPEPIVNKLYDESQKFLTMPGTRERLAGVGVIVSPMRPTEFGAFIRSEIKRWTADAKAAGIEAK